MEFIISSKDFDGEKISWIKRYIEEAMESHSVLQDYKIKVKTHVQKGIANSKGKEGN